MSDKEVAKKVISDMREHQRQLGYDINEVVDTFLGEGEAQWLSIDTFWECPDSPFGWCAYHIIEDPARDSCIFCHEPQERK